MEEDFVINACAKSKPELANNPQLLRKETKEYLAWLLRQHYEDQNKNIDFLIEEIEAMRKHKLQELREKKEFEMCRLDDQILELQQNLKVYKKRD